MQNYFDLYRLALFGMYILAEALQNFISFHAAITLAIQTHFFRGNSSVLQNNNKLTFEKPTYLINRNMHV